MKQELKPLSFAQNIMRTLMKELRLLTLLTEQNERHSKWMYEFYFHIQKKLKPLFSLPCFCNSFSEVWEKFGEAMRVRKNIIDPEKL